MKKVTILLICVFALAHSALAQTKISGLVVSEEDGQPIIGATVVVKGTTVGTVTDVSGKFFLTVANEVKTLVFSYIGMETIEEPIRPTMKVTMKSDALHLEELVVTGYGVSKKAAFTGAAQVVNKDALLRRTDANVMKSLEGTVAGLQVNSFSGQPGAYISTTIRGMGSVNSGTEPLYVIDGIPMSTDKLGINSIATRGEMAASPMSNINSNDIESITVLKDATATSIYGARAANGVIVITTKRGERGKARVSFNAKAGVSSVINIDNNYRTVNLDRYKEIWTEGLVNSGLSQADATANLNNTILDGWGVDLTDPNLKSVDWLNEILKTGVSQEYDLSIQGGNENLRFFISGSYFQNEGVVIGTGMKRYSGRTSLDGKSGRLGYGISISAAHSDINNTMTESQYSNPLVAVYDTRPFEQVYNADNTYNEGVYYNPVALADPEKGDKQNQKQTTFVANPYFTVKLTDHFTWKSNAGMSLLYLDEFFYQGRYNPQYKNKGYYGLRNIEQALNLSLTNSVNYMRSFGKNELNILLGEELQRKSYGQIYTAAGNYPSDAVFELDNASKPLSANSNKKASTLSSWFTNVEYSYNNKYYGSASFRYDGSSRFGTNNKWAPFWSVGGKYRLTAEEFMKPSASWLSDLTVRASYGTVGNQDIGEFAAMGLFEYGYSYDSKPGAIPYQIANPDLKWETVAKANIGINAVLFNRLSIEVDFYNERTKDMIFSVPLSLTTGIRNVMKNIGEMENKGIEFLINWIAYKDNNNTFSINIAGTKNNNKIVKLATDHPIERSTTIRKVGLPYYSFYLPEYAGVNPETGAPQWYYTKELPDGSTENAKTETFSQAEQRVVGSADPKFFGGLGLSYQFKNFDVSFDSNFSVGGKVFNSGFSFDMQMGDYKYGPVSNYVYENRWQKPGDITDVPKFVFGNTTSVSENSSRFLMDGSYWRLKNITLGYTLPSALVKRANMNTVRFYVTGENLFTARSKDYIGFDPQVRPSGEQAWQYPVPATLIVGLNVSF